MTPELQALAYLDRDPVHFADMYEVLRRGSGVLHYAGEDGVILRDGVSDSYFMSATDPRAASRLLALLPPDCQTLCGHETDYLLEAANRVRRGDVQLCYNALYQGGHPLPLPPGDYTLRLLAPQHAPYVMAHYSRAFGGLAYMERAIGRGMLGAFVGEVLAGFVGTHEEGAMGLLEVLPAYRGRGLGLALEAGAINLALERGQLAFDQVMEGNDASFALQRKLGLTLSPKRLFWLF